MKKKTLSNLIMVAIIAIIVIFGILLALFLTAEEENPLGSEFSAAEIKDNRLIEDENSSNICTVTIRCDTVLSNIASLEESKIPYVPANGEILPVISVEFTPGETVFDVLKKVCEAANLQIEYSWSPIYDSYYVEGINHLYEFDCGVESGWMYKVNGRFPNYGCSAYELQGGEELVWAYTCVGLGMDLGAERMD